MKMKCHKIRGIDKNICTCEQKIAYNFAFSWVETGKRILKSDMCEAGKSQAFSDIEKSVLRSLERDEFKRFNLDAIIVAFRHGFKEYCTDYFIATDYKRVGEAFQIPYEII